MKKKNFLVHKSWISLKKIFFWFKKFEISLKKKNFFYGSKNFKFGWKKIFFLVEISLENIIVFLVQKSLNFVEKKKEFFLVQTIWNIVEEKYFFLVKKIDVEKKKLFFGSKNLKFHWKKKKGIFFWFKKFEI